MISDNELDLLIKGTSSEIADNGFSQDVTRKMRRWRILSRLIPALFGTLGLLIMRVTYPQEDVSSIIPELTNPLFDASQMASGELLRFLTSRGMDPSLIWLLLLVPLLVVPFALHQE